MAGDIATRADVNALSREELDDALTALVAGFARHSGEPLFANAEGACQVRLAGDVERAFVIRFAAGRVEAADGEVAEPALTITGDARTFAAWCYCRGRDAPAQTELTIDGDLQLYFQIYSCFGVAPALVRRGLSVLRARPPTRTLARLDDRDHAAIKEHIHDKRPFVVEGGARGWKAMSWTVDDIRGRFAELTLWDRFLGFERRLGDVLEAVLESSLEQPRSSGATADLPAEMVRELGTLEWLEHQPDHVETFLSGRGAVTPIHTDLVDGAAVVFLGDRLFTLYPPCDVENVYAHGTFMGDAQLCYLANPWKPDYEKFARIREASPIHVVLHPGDVIFLPAGWWHAVMVLETSITTKFSYDIRNSWQGFPPS